MVVTSERQMSLAQWVRVWGRRAVVWLPTKISQIIKSYRAIPLEEKRGYYFWGPVALIIAFFEIGAATAKWWRGGPADWPTISTAVGHLETEFHFVAVVVVAVIALVGFYALAYKTSPRKPNPKKSTAEDWGLRRYGLYMAFLLVLLTFFASVGSLRATDKDAAFRVGYALYGSLALWGILVPLFLRRFFPGWVNFPTLFATVESLRTRFAALAVIALAGLAVLVIHLAIYPWPDSPHESTGYANLSSSEAREKAENRIAALKNDDLFYTSQVRGHIGHPDDGQDVWLVYFNGAEFPDSGDSGCVVAVREGADPIESPGCSP
jgi:hypothetical protein